MLNGVYVTEQSDKLGHIILRVYEGEFNGCEFYYDKVAFADHANVDGTINVNFEYVITNGYEVSETRLAEFQRFAGDNLVALIEDAMEKDTAVYYGGEGGTLVE